MFRSVAGGHWWLLLWRSFVHLSVLPFKRAMDIQEPSFDERNGGSECNFSVGLSLHRE
jgi:hypothetical protein